MTEQAVSSAPEIAAEAEVMRFYTGVMRGTLGGELGDITMRDRARAAEALGKAYGLFRERDSVDQAAIRAAAERLQAVVEEVSADIPLEWPDGG